jgi:hypothetical protein
MRKIVRVWLLAALIDASMATDSCRSNRTHLAWSSACHYPHREGQEEEQDGGSMITITTKSFRRRARGNQQDHHYDDSIIDSCFYCEYETISQAQLSAYRYLRKNIMAFDLPFLQTLGFVDDDESNNNINSLSINNNNNNSTTVTSLPDGLGNGLIGPTIEYALQTKQNYTWADAVSKPIFYEYILNYANLNEARTNWRPLLYEQLHTLIADKSLTVNITTLPQAVIQLNTHIWTRLAPRHQESIVFVSGQTPLIFDTMSTLAFGHASCTGLAILFVNALRTFGIPARVVGTPAWHQNQSAGNHNWVEVWYQNQWYFMEPSATRTEDDDVDSLERDPCRRWFCQPSRFSMDAKTTTRVSAAKLEFSENDNTFYRMAWEWNNPSVPGEDVTNYYQEICSKC